MPKCFISDHRLFCLFSVEDFALRWWWWWWCQSWWCWYKCTCSINTIEST